MTQPHKTEAQWPGAAVQKWTIHSTHPAEKQHPPKRGCENCDGRGCMGCVCRQYDHECANDCPICCEDNFESESIEVVRLSDYEQLQSSVAVLEEALEVEQEEAVRFRDERNVLREALEAIHHRSTHPWRRGCPWTRQQWAADLAEAAMSHPADPEAADAALQAALSTFKEQGGTDA